MAIQNNIKIKKPHFKNLDALRFMAAFAVFAFHFFKEISAIYKFDANTLGNKIINLFLSKGTLGVNFFFVLSGFLITYLILWERKNTGNFNVKHFLIRRTLRIWPLYFMVVFIGFFVFPYVITDYSTNHSAWYYLFFLANFDEIRAGLTDSINFLTAPWSVAVEEQFYLFWGLLLFVLHKVKAFNIWITLAALLLISIVFSYLNYSFDRILYYHTFSVMSNIIIGSTLALAYFQEKQWLLNLRELKRWKIAGIYLIGFLIIIAKNKLFVGSFSTIEHSCISLFFAFIIFDQVYLTNSFYKIGKIKLFTYLGKISYGLYLFHLIVMFLVLNFVMPLLIDLPPVIGISIFGFLTVIGTYIVSYTSYNYFEKPFLALKSKFK